MFLLRCMPSTQGSYQDESRFDPVSERSNHDFIITLNESKFTALKYSHQTNHTTMMI